MTATLERLTKTDGEADAIFVTIPLVAKMRDVSTRTVERDIAAGRLPSVRTMPGGRRLIAWRDAGRPQ